MAGAKAKEFQIKFKTQSFPVLHHPSDRQHLKLQVHTTKTRFTNSSKGSDNNKRPQVRRKTGSQCDAGPEKYSNYQNPPNMNLVLAKNYLNRNVRKQTSLQGMENTPSRIPVAQVTDQWRCYDVGSDKSCLQ